MKRNIAIALIMYLGFGIIFALWAWTEPLKTFTCQALHEPHGTIGIGGMWQNLDSARCTRDGLTVGHIASLPYLAVAWPFVIGANIVNDWQENERRKTAALEHRMTQIQAAHTQLPDTLFLCGWDVRADRVLIQGIDVARVIAHIENNLGAFYLCENLQRFYTHFLDGELGVAVEEWQWDNEGRTLPKTQDGHTNVYRTVLYEKNDTRQAADPFNQSTFIYKFDFNTDLVYRQGQHDGGFTEIGFINAKTTQNEIQSLTLTDGEETWAGVYHVSPVENGLKSFTSAVLGISFSYPAEYLLFTTEASEDTIREIPFYEGYHGILVALEKPMLHSIAHTRAGIGGEGPPSIHFSFYRNHDSVSLEEVGTHEFVCKLETRAPAVGGANKWTLIDHCCRSISLRVPE